MNGWMPSARGQYKVNAAVTRKKKKKESDRGAMAIIIRDHEGFCILGPYAMSLS